MVARTTCHRHYGQRHDRTVLHDGDAVDDTELNLGDKKKKKKKKKVLLDDAVRLLVFPNLCTYVCDR